GVYRFLDIDGDGNITALNDRSIADRPTQWFGGIENSFRLHGFSLRVFLQVTYRTDRDHRAFFGMPGILQNQPVEVMQRWQQEGEQAAVARFSRGSATVHSRYLSSDANFNTDRSFARI